MQQLQSASQRAPEIIKSLDPVRLADVLLEFASVVESQFWDGRRTGPDFISPMASLTKRQSGHLAKLVLQYSKTLPAFNVRPTGPNMPCQDDGVVPLHSDDSDTGSVQEYVQVHSQTVAVLDLGNGHQDHELQEPQTHQEVDSESQYATLAEIDLMVLVPILFSFLVILRTHQWSPSVEFILIDFIAALILGPGTLKLVRRTSMHPVELDPDLGCAVLMDDDITVVIRGSQRIVEAITEGGFYLSLANSQTLSRTEESGPTSGPVTERWQEKQVISDVLYGTLEGGCRGACEAMLMRFFHLYFAFPYLRETAYVLVFGRMMGQACWWGLKASNNDSLAPIAGVTPLRSVARLTGEFLGLLIVVACVTSTSSSTILLHGVSFFVQSFYFGLFARLVFQSQNYLVRTQRLLNALHRPVIKKWAFRTRASAATFVSFVLCRNIPRPVRTIHVRGVLDILIPDQREVWRAWKDRVADRIAHEDRVDFTPTIPTFPDSTRQKRLKELLDEAQTAHDGFYHAYFPTNVQVK